MKSAKIRTYQFQTFTVLLSKNIFDSQIRLKIGLLDQFLMYAILSFMILINQFWSNLTIMYNESVLLILSQQSDLLDYYSNTQLKSLRWFYRLSFETPKSYWNGNTYMFNSCKQRIIFSGLKVGYLSLENLKLLLKDWN